MDIKRLDDEKMEHRNKSLREQRICNGNYETVRITKIEKIDRKSCNQFNEIQDTIVYDLKIEDDHSYVANGIIVHNCHHIPATEFYKTSEEVDAFYKLGLSATPERTDGSTLKMIAAIGEVIKVSSIKELIQKGILAKPSIKIVNAPPGKGGSTYAEAKKNSIILNDERSKLIARLTYEQVNKNQSVLITVDSIPHGKRLETLIKDSIFIHGKTKKEIRESELEKFKNGERKVVISTLLSEGSDIPDLRVIINAGGGKSEPAHMQKIGRALRTTETKKTALIIDIVDQGKWLRDHAQNRIRLYHEIFGDLAVYI